MWAVNFEKAREVLPKEMRSLLDTNNANGFSVDMLEELGTSPLDLDKHEEQEMFALFFEPPSMDDRIVNQYALFSVLSQSKTTFIYWLSMNNEIWYKLIIPSSLKWEIRDKLDQANITERMPFSRSRGT